MNDTLREYCSYGQFILPLLKVKKQITPQKIQWGNKHQYFLDYAAACPISSTLVIYIHGGGWNSGSPKDFHFIGQRIALEGYDCIMPGYRKSPKYHYEDIVDDIFAGFVHIRNHLATHARNYDKIIVMGSSAGAHLGALLCFDTQMQSQFQIPPDTFSGFISLAGPLCFDFPQTGTLNILLKDLFGTKDKASWKKGEPLSKLQQKVPVKTLLIQSSHDGLVGYEQAKHFLERLTALGIPAALTDVPEKQNTHSAYSAGIFLKNKAQSPTLTKIFDWLYQETH